MFEAIINDLQMVGVAMLLLFGAWVANTALSLYNNIALNLDSFDKIRFLTGFLKLIAIAVGTGVTSIVISALPLFLTQYGINIGEGTSETFSVIVVVGLYASAVMKYLKQCIEKITIILEQ